MESRDKQIDVLIRRYATEVGTAVESAHLDADELNAFAEGAMPAAARGRYISHLADCRECRRLASQLTISAGPTSSVLAADGDEIAQQNWWRRFNIFLAPATMRYAAVAVVLMAVVGIAFIVFRRPNPPASDLVAEGGPTQTPVKALQPSQSSASPAGEIAKTSGTPFSGPARSTADANSNQPGYATTKEAVMSPAAVSPKTGAETANAAKPASAAERKAQPLLEQTPSYAPPPSAETERAENMTQAKQSLSRTDPSGNDKNETYNKYKVLDRSRSAEAATDREEDRKRATTNVASPNKDKRDEQQVNGRRNTRNSNLSAGAADLRMESNSAPPSKTETEPSTQPRSVGGRKFRKQANAWIDLKFKSSMSVRNVARGSSEFAALDSGLRSIAQQLSGEVVVVWKGKAYRIQ